MSPSRVVRTTRRYFTEDRGKLAQVLGRDVSRRSVHMPEIAPKLEHSIGLKPTTERR
jgi:hypothetical protein